MNKTLQKKKTKPRKKSGGNRLPPPEKHVVAVAETPNPKRLFIFTGRMRGLPAEMRVEAVAKTEKEAVAILYLLCDHIAEIAKGLRT